jgi:hypothetical protein
MGGPIVMAPTTCEVSVKQYMAATAGHSIVAFALRN